MMTETAHRGVDVADPQVARDTWLATAADPHRRNGSGVTAPGARVAVASVRRALRITHGSTAPDTFADDRGTAVFDGVLYNRAELKAELVGSRRDGPTSDAELALRAHRRWADEAFRRLNGVFAVVIHDAERESVVAARDPLGVYPLFYADAGRELLLSTAVESLLAHPSVSRQVNRVALADDLAYRWPDPEETFYSAVRRVPPGHVLKAAGGRMWVSRYWDPAPVDADIEWARPDEMERFDHLLERAVDRCLGLGPTGIFLSGGLDSVSIAALAVDLCRRRGTPAPLALSLAFPHPDCNEEPIQRSVARQLGMSHVVIPFDEAVGGRGLLAEALDWTRTLPLPLINLWTPAYVGLARAGLQRGCRVMLTGGGGDEWLTVSPYYAADLLMRLDVPALYRLWDSMRRSFPGSGLAFLRSVVWQFGLRALVGEWGRQLLARRVPALLRARWRGHIHRNTPPWVAPDPAIRRELECRHESDMKRPRARSLYVRWGRQAIESALMSMEKEELFEVGRRVGYRELMPYWDAELIELLYRAPVELLNRGHRSKGLVRHSVAQRFPELGFESQRKVTATTFYRSIMATQGPPLWKDLGGARALADLAVVDPRGVAALADAVLFGSRGNDSHRLWEVMKLEAWVRPRL